MYPNKEQRSWPQAFGRALWSGSAASVVTTGVLTMCGARDGRDAARPVNGPSQWIWGRHAAHRRGFDLPHTVVGYLIHHAMSVFWATLFEKLPKRPTPRDALIAAAATSAIAYTVDYRVVPDRFTPGFQKHLTRTSLLVTYGAFALALAGVALVRRP